MLTTFHHWDHDWSVFAECLLRKRWTCSSDFTSVRIQTPQSQRGKTIGQNDSCGNRLCLGCNNSACRISFTALLSQCKASVGFLSNEISVTEYSENPSYETWKPGVRLQWLSKLKQKSL